MFAQKIMKIMITVAKHQKIGAKSPQITTKTALCLLNHPDLFGSERLEPVGLKDEIDARVKRGGLLAY